MVRQKTGTIHVKWVRSGIAFPRQQKEMVASLGLRHLNQVVERPDTAQIRGVVAKIPHLLQVVPTPASPSWAAVAEYEIVAGETAPRPGKAGAKRVEAAPEAVATRLPQPESAATEVVEGADSRKKAGAQQARVSAIAEEPAAKSEEKKPRKRKAVEGKESKFPKKGKK